MIVADFFGLGVTAHPTAEWIVRQVTEACGWDGSPQYLIRDRDRVYGKAFTRRLRAMGIRDRPTAPRSPWQNGHAERLIGSLRRECLDHLVVFGEQHLRHVLRSYAEYYNSARTHLSLAKDAPICRSLGAFFRFRSSADCITIMSGSDFRQAQLLKLGINVGQTSVAKYMIRRRRLRPAGADAASGGSQSSTG
jgi:hypothetical protein